MELTREEAITKYRKQWKWHAENPMKQKKEYPFGSGIPFKLCYLCELTGMTCSNCPVEWPKTHEPGIRAQGIPCIASYYGDWENAIAPEERSRLAALIRDLPEKAVEDKADFKVGDWVKVLDDGHSFSTYGSFFAENNLKYFADKYARQCPINGESYQIVATGKHSSRAGEYGPIYVLQSQDGGIYLMNDGRGSHPQKALELTDPPAAKPKYAVGGKVVPTSKSVWFSGDSMPNCTSWKNGKLQKEYLTVTQLTKDNGFLRGEVNGGQMYICDGDFYLESDLTPYVEPVVETKADPKPEVKPAFNVGDRVRVIEEDTTYGTDAKGKTGTISYTENPSHTKIQFDVPLHYPNGVIARIGENNEYGLPAKYLELITEPETAPTNLCPEKKTVTELSISYKFDGAVTTCIIQTEDGLFVGKAKCNPADAWDEKAGRDLAYLRAHQKKIKADIKQLKGI